MKLHAYLDESGSFSDASGVSLVAGFTSALPPDQASQRVAEAIEEISDATGLEARRLMHLTELRQSLRERGDTVIPPIVTALVGAVTKRMRDLRFFCLSGKGLPSVTDGDTFYLDLAAESFASLAVAMPEVDEWCFVPAKRVKERFHGIEIPADRKAELFFDESGYAAALTQRLMDRLTPLGRGNLRFTVEAKTPQSCQALVVADYTANCRYRFSRGKEDPDRRLWREAFAPRLSGDYSMGSLGLSHEVRTSLLNGQWDNAFITIIKASCAMAEGSRAPLSPETAFPELWAMLLQGYRSDDDLETTIADLLDSIDSPSEFGSLAEALAFTALDRLVASGSEGAELARARFFIAAAEARSASKRGMLPSFQAARDRLLTSAEGIRVDNSSIVTMIELSRLEAETLLLALDLDGAAKAAEKAVEAHRDRIAALTLLPFGQDSRGDDHLASALLTRARVALSTYRLDAKEEWQAQAYADIAKAIACSGQDGVTEGCHLVLAALALHKGDGKEYLRELDIATREDRGDSPFDLKGIQKSSAKASLLLAVEGAFAGGEASAVPELKAFSKKAMEAWPPAVSDGEWMPDRLAFAIDFCVLALSTRRNEAAKLLARIAATMDSARARSPVLGALLMLRIRLAELTLSGKNEADAVDVTMKEVGVHIADAPLRRGLYQASVALVMARPEDRVELYRRVIGLITS